MKAFRVTKGTSSWVIALGDRGVLNATVLCVDTPNHDEERTELTMGGLDSDTDTHIHWHPVDLRIGDQVTIEVIENCEGDEPDEFQINDPAKNKELAKQYIRDEAKKLGWTIVEND